MRNQWTEIELENALNLHEHGFTFAEIAAKLNRTEKAIKVKLGRCGLRQNKINYNEEVNCLTCSKIFIGKIDDNRKFCSHACAAIHNNKFHVRKIKQEKENKRYRDRYHELKKNHCLNCGSLVYSIYCNTKCQKEYKVKLIFNKIESDEPIHIGSDTTNHRYYKKYLIKIHGEKCMKCGWNEVNQYSNKVPIELEHVDGNSDNNKLYNLKLLCPNCHSLTSTYKALNKGNGRHDRMKRYNEGKSY